MLASLTHWCQLLVTFGEAKLGPNLPPHVGHRLLAFIIAGRTTRPAQDSVLVLDRHDGDWTGWLRGLGSALPSLLLSTPGRPAGRRV